MKIVNYNPILFEQTNQHSKLADINLYKKLMSYNFSKDNFLVDRTQSISHFLDIDYSYAPIPVSDNFDLDFNSRSSLIKVLIRVQV